MKAKEQEIIVNLPYPENLITLLKERSKRKPDVLKFLDSMTIDILETKVLNCLSPRITERFLDISLWCFVNSKSIEDAFLTYHAHPSTISNNISLFLSDITHAIQFIIDYENIGDEMNIQLVSSDFVYIFAISTTGWYRLTIKDIKNITLKEFEFYISKTYDSAICRKVIKGIVDESIKYDRLFYVFGKDHPIFSYIKSFYERRMLK